MNSKISEYLNLFREIKSNSDLKISTIKINIVLIIGLMFLIIIESLFYLPPEIRFPMTLYFSVIYLLFTCYIILKYLFNNKNLFNNSSDEYIAQLIGAKFLDIKDKLINVYQLEQKIDKNKQIEYELSLHAINKVEKELSSLVVSFNSNTIRLLIKRLYVTFIICFSLTILFNNYTFSFEENYRITNICVKLFRKF